MARYTLEEGDAACVWANSYTRMKTILELRRHMSAPDWWQLLGSNWDICDNIASHKYRLRSLLLNANPTNLRAMMRSHERRALAAMPDEITVYRGCYEVNRDGLSWSLSPEVAAGFVKLNRYSRENEIALLLTGIASKAHAVLKLERKEREVICPMVKVIDERPIASAVC